MGINEYTWWVRRRWMLPMVCHYSGRQRISNNNKTYPIPHISPYCNRTTMTTAQFVTRVRALPTAPCVVLWLCVLCVLCAPNWPPTGGPVSGGLADCWGNSFGSCDSRSLVAFQSGTRPARASAGNIVCCVCCVCVGWFSMCLSVSFCLCVRFVWMTVLSLVLHSASWIWLRTISCVVVVVRLVAFLSRLVGRDSGGFVCWMKLFTAIVGANIALLI